MESGAEHIDRCCEPDCEVTVPIDGELEAAFAERIIDRLQALNRDLREAMREHPGGARPIVELHPLGAGPFASDAGKIKQVRLQPSR